METLPSHSGLYKNFYLFKCNHHHNIGKSNSEAQTEVTLPTQSQDLYSQCSHSPHVECKHLMVSRAHVCVWGACPVSVRNKHN